MSDISCHQLFPLGADGAPDRELTGGHVPVPVGSFELAEFSELGMAAVRRIEAADFPAVIVVDDKGDDFFAALA